MADPATLAIGSMAASGAGGVMGAIGHLFTGDAQSQAYRYQAGVARQNEQILKGNADYERHVGEIKAQEEGMKTAQDIGDTKAKQAGSGVDIASGSSKAVRDTQLEVGQYDQALIRAGAARRAYGYEVEATSEEAKARMADAGADTAKTAGILGAFSSLINAGGSVANKWLQYDQVFPTGGNPTSPGPYQSPVYNT